MNKILLVILYLIPIIIILTYKNKNKYMFTLIYILTISSIFAMNSDIDDSMQAIKYKNYEMINMMSVNNINKKIDDEKNKEQNTASKQKVNNQINSNEENLEKKSEYDNSQVQVINIEKEYNKNLNNDQLDVVDSSTNKGNSSDNKKDEKNKEEELDELQIFNNFKKELQDIEKKGLVPLRKCYGVLKKLQKGKANMDELLKEAQNSRQKCEQVELMYKDLKVPKFKDEENTKLLLDAKMDIQKAFYIRKKAMDYGIDFLDKKNPKYIIKIKNNLKLSDKLVHSCQDKMNKVKFNLKK
ncbi:hypothetical protein [Tepidibacter hydrothermalis]|uniref:DUF5667 domain-containing protein n=1 Tax=Tepidibacter hydrothermalis TaxID=3036126 RepID=A0ABY8EA79_9FIRM|nr:hypothetical protein [Tepidibacter hydrothermalis]WFD09804.1 hypothetical protein P4S50_15605 [Tepidibacter hydrothermalis]